MLNNPPRDAGTLSLAYELSRLPFNALLDQIRTLLSLPPELRPLAKTRLHLALLRLYHHIEQGNFHA
jgi:hypothetical protein